MRKYDRTFTHGPTSLQFSVRGWGVMGLNARTGDVEMRQYDADSQGLAREHAARLERATVAPII